MYNALPFRPGWSPFTILLMVLGFIAWWPLGLAMVAFNVWGHRLPEFRRNAREAGRGFARDFRGCGARRWNGYGASYSSSGNVAFDDYRRREFERLEAERRRLDEERQEFETFMANLRRARDQEEFDRFMAERRKDRPADQGPGQDRGPAA